MKRIFTCLICTLFVITIFAQPQKVVLIEEGTGTWCQWCPRGDIYAQELEKNYSGQYVFVAIHEGDPMEYPEYFNASGLTGLPSGNIDRTYTSGLDPFNEIHQDMNQQLALDPPASIAVSTTWDSNTREMTMAVTAEFAEDLNGDYRLAAIVVEDGVTGPAPSYDQSNSYSGGGNGAMGGYEDLPSPVSASIMVFNHVGRYLAGGYMGDSNSLPNSISTGETHNYTFSYTLPNEYDEAYVHAVGVLIDASSGTVLNAGKSDYLLGYSNAKPFFHSTPQDKGFVGLNYKYDIVTHDPEHDDLTITALTGLPTGLSLVDLGDGFAELTGIPTQLGTFEVTLNVNDGEWNVEQTFQITIGEPEEDWVQVGAEGFSSTSGFSVDIEIGANGVPYVMNAINANVYVYEYKNDTWSLLGNSFSGGAFHTSMAVDPEGMPIVFTEGKVSKWNGNQWEQIGGNVPGIAFLYPDIIQAGDGSLFTVHFDPPNITVAHQFDGTNWQSVGNITDDVGVWTRFNLDENGNPIAIYGTDGQNIAFSEVSRWDGNQWNLLGNGYIEPNSQTYFDHDVAVTPNGDVFAALTIGVGLQSLNIYQLINDEWELIQENLAGGAIESCNLESDAEGNLIVAFRDGSNGGRTSVMKYDGSDWNYMGLPGFTNVASDQSLALDLQGNPYVAYQDASQGDKLSVKKFEDLTNNIFATQITDYQLSIYPNPNKGQFILEFEKGTQFQILDVSGKLMSNGDLSPDSQQNKLKYQHIDIGGISSGVYFLRVIGNEGIQTVKLVRQ